MTRYFFDTADGDNDIDDRGVELDTDDQALTEAVRFAGSMIADRPDLLTGEDEFIVSVRADMAPLATIRLQLSRA